MNRDVLHSLSILELLENKNRLLLAVEELDYLCEEVKAEQAELTATNEMLKAAVHQLGPQESQGTSMVSRFTSAVGDLWGRFGRQNQANELRELLIQEPSFTARDVEFVMEEASKAPLTDVIPESQEVQGIEANSVKRSEPPKLSDLPALLYFSPSSEAQEEKRDEDSGRSRQETSQLRGVEGRSLKKRPSQKTKSYKIDL
jgi:hypothetical protein